MTRIPGYLLAAVLLPGAAAQAPAPSADAGRAARIRAAAPLVGKMFREYAEKNHLPGLSYGVVTSGGPVFSGGVGYANLAAKIPADSQTLFRIASNSKSFTALAILQLRDAGKLRLDDPAADYVPEMKGLAPPASDAPAVTIRHLLTHAAGLPEDNPWGDRRLADTDEEFSRLVQSGVSFANVPGVAFEYSNLGFALLGRIVRNVSGMSYERYAAEFIFKPLGMTRTIWDFREAPPGSLASGYGRRDDAWFEEPPLPPGAYDSMGGLITSIEDFSRYAALHLSAWPPRDGAEAGPLRRSSLREMHQPWNFSGLNPKYSPAGAPERVMASAYGYGLFWRRDAGERVYVGHSGGLPGYGSGWVLAPDYDIAVVAFDNRTYGTTYAVDLAVLDAVVEQAGLKPREVPPSDILARKRAELLGVLPDFEASKTAGLFADNFFIDVPREARRAEAKKLFDAAGGVRGAGPLTPENRLRGTFRLEGKTKDIEVFFTLTPEPEPRIQELTMTGREK